jgi:hypothetical protein
MLLAHVVAKLLEQRDVRDVAQRGRKAARELQIAVADVGTASSVIEVAWSTSTTAQVSTGLTSRIAAWGSLLMASTSGSSGWATPVVECGFSTLTVPMVGASRSSRWKPPPSGFTWNTGLEMAPRTTRTSVPGRTRGESESPDAM